MQGIHFTKLNKNQSTLLRSQNDAKFKLIFINSNFFALKL